MSTQDQSPAVQTTHVLRIDSSPRDAASKTRDLTDLAVRQLQDSGTVTVTQRDIDQGLPYVSKAWTSGAYKAASERTAEERDALALSDTLVAEVKAADVIVIGLPMYNFNVPASVKAWFDQIARVGLTFKYSDKGPEGLLANKRVIGLVATGGVPVGSDHDRLTPYVRAFFNFLGIETVEFHAADGLNGEKAEQSLADAKAAIRKIDLAA